jgi:micrococcal nuclease
MEDNREHTYWAKPLRVVDGDTVELLVRLPFYTSITIRARLIGVDTPERGEADFDRASEMLSKLLDDVKDEHGWIFIRTERTGKFGRWLVHIYGVNETLASIWPYER